MIACRRLGAVREEMSGETQSTKQGILAVVSIDRHLATLSIVQRYHYKDHNLYCILIYIVFCSVKLYFIYMYFYQTHCRVNQPSTPPKMINSTSSNDLGKALMNGNNLTLSSENGDANAAKMNGGYPPYSPSKTSREGSVDGEDLVYASVPPMSQGKCGVGVESYEVRYYSL